ncbi:energy transducer TonB [uncultured Sphingomonas sp.]|uniref:energy transducer TonB n=1 Tax=uncultured Sphingomonas sp. TaxID=158754 RepID=UPI0025D7D5B5|nr:energy transducer TonB [uncultured Sphingomonas sp.]
MQVSASIGPDGGRRRTAVMATAMVHVAFVALLLWGAPQPSTTPAERPPLNLFDLPRPPDPPLVPVAQPPVAARPVKQESAVLRPTAGGGSPRPTRAPVAEQAAPAAAAPARFDRVDRPAPAAEFSTDLPLRAGTAASDGRGVGIASGRGTGGEGHGTGNGRGDGDGPGEGRLRFALAEWIEKPPQDLIDEAFPRMARNGGVSGVAVLLCFVPTPGRPKSCSIAAERPRGSGFGAAALGLYPKFRIRPVMKGDEVYQAQVLVPVTFDVKKRP